MAREVSLILDSNDLFPEMEFPAAAGGSIVLPRDFRGRWAVFIVYRGDW